MRVVDFYSESNKSQNTSVYGSRRAAQSFAGDGGVISEVLLFLSKSGTISGNCQVEIFDISGTFGSSSVPTGPALATSDPVDVSTVPSFSTHSLISFKFSGANKIKLVDGAKYAIVVSFTGGDSSNYLYPGVDATSPTHPGNLAVYTGSWTALSGSDMCFYIYADTPRQSGSFFFAT